MWQIVNRIFICLLIFEFVTVNGANEKLQEKFSWKQVDFDFPDEKTREEAISSGRYIREHNLPLGLEIWKNKLFITLPRWKEGIMATLTYVNLNDAEKSPKLIPYPNWAAHDLRNSSDKSTAKITSVFRLNADVCDRLWLVDHGVDDIFGKSLKLHSPKIQIYNLHDDKLLKEYTFPNSVIRDNSFLANIVVDVTAGNCETAYAYVPDLGSYSLIVYNLEQNDSYRVTHHFFHFDPLAGDYNIGGINFQWHDGIFGVALSPTDETSGFRTLYFHPMSSTREFAVSTKVIRNKTIASDSYHEFRVLGSRGPNSQSSASGIDQKTGVLFYTLLNKDAVGCWNIRNEEYSVDTNAILASDSETMIFPNDLKVDYSGNLWVLTDRLPTMLYSTLNYSDVNYRIFTAPVQEIIKGTICERS